MTVAPQKGFPEERPNLQKELEDYFETFGPVASVRMRRTDKKEGSKFKVRFTRNYTVHVC